MVSLLEAGRVSYDIHVKSVERSTRVDSHPHSIHGASESFIERRRLTLASEHEISRSRPRSNGGSSIRGCHYSLRHAISTINNLIYLRHKQRGSRGGRGGEDDLARAPRRTRRWRGALRLPPPSPSASRTPEATGAGVPSRPLPCDAFGADWPGGASRGTR